MSLFEVKNLSFKYDKYNKEAKNIINNISFKVEKKDFIAIIGKSGSGKSTLISHLNGILKADSGDILYEGKSIYDKSFDLTALRYKCGVVFQYPEYQLFAETVIQDVCFGAIKKGMTEEEAKNKALEILKLLGVEKLKDDIPFILSGGEKRKVALAGVLVMEPEVLILDEPEAGLDSYSKNELFELLIELNKNGTTIIFITHNLDDVMEYANRVIVINEGEIVGDDTTYNILSNEKLLSSYNLDMPNAIKIANAFNNKKKVIDTDRLKFNQLVESIYDLKVNSSKNS